MARVIVVGSINVDLVATAPHLPLPGETVAGHDFARHPGGKGANQAVASARAGAPTSMVGCVGDDPFGREQRAHLAACGVDVSSVAVDPTDPTGVALIVVDDAGENSIVVVAGANGQVGADAARAAVAELDLGPGDVVVAQHETPLAGVAAAYELAARAGATTVLNPAPVAGVPSEVLASCDLLVVNEVELAQVSGRSIADAADVDAVGTAAAAVAAAHDVVVVATLGAHGVVAVEGSAPTFVPARPVEHVVDTTGAGDCFVGSLAARTAAGDALGAALDYAVAASALCVQRPGAGSSMPSRAEVERSLDQLS